MISKDVKAEQSENVESGGVWKMNVTYANIWAGVLCNVLKRF